MKINFSLKTGVRLAISLAIFGGLAACATTAPRPGNVLQGLALQGAGDSIALYWSANSPLARSFRSNESVHLYASYPSQGGKVTGEDIASGVVDLSRNLVAIRLPGRLDRVPTGPVCLQLGRSRSQRIPLRVHAPGETSDSFRYAAWEPIARTGTRRKVIKRSIAAVEHNLGLISSHADEFIAWRNSKDLSNASQCETIRANVEVSRPGSAVAPRFHEIEASKQCVRQFVETCVRLEAPANITTDLFRILAGAGYPEQDSAVRIVHDLRSYGAMLNSEKRKLDSSGLGLTASTISSYKNQGLNPSNAAAIVNAYDVCLEEAKGQFKMSYDTWQAEQSERPGRIAERSSVLREECRASFANEAELLRQIDDLKNDRERLAAELAGLPSREAFPLPRQISLAGSRCN